MTSVSHFWIIRYKINVRNPEAAMNLKVCFPRLTSVLLLNETVPCSSITIRLIWQCSVSRSTLFALRLESFYTWTTESKHNERCLEKQDEIFRLRRYDTVWFLSECSLSEVERWRLSALDNFELHRLTHTPFLAFLELRAKKCIRTASDNFMNSSFGKMSFWGELI